MTPDPLYYLTNFKAAIAWVVDRSGDLLSGEEIEFTRSFLALPVVSQALLVRLLMRLGTAFRRSKINYAEIADLDSALDPLIALRWIDPDAGLTLEELFKLSTREELAAGFDQFNTRSSKHEVYQRLLRRYTDVATYTQWLATPESVYRVLIGSMATRFRLLFFGSFHQEWSEIVLAQLEIFKFEKVQVSIDSRPFGTRDDIECFYALHACREAFNNGAPLAEVLWLLPEGAINNEWLEERREKLRFQIGEAAERAGDIESALLLYQDCSYPDARVRAARVLERLGQFEQAAAVASQSMLEYRTEAQAQKLERIAARMEKRMGSCDRKRIGRDVPTVVLKLPFREGTRVEFAVRDHLAREHAPVFYVENSLICSLFGLLCWEAIFQPLRGAFFHAYHRGPADLRSPLFVSRRQAAFEECLARLDSGAHEAHILRAYEEKQGTQSPFVHWGLLSDTLLDFALKCIEPAHLRFYFDRLLRGIAENCTGLPDLIQFDLTQRTYQLVEVKGPGDQLQDNQRRWIKYCVEHSLPIKVCHVDWTTEVSSHDLRKGRDARSRDRVD